MPTGRLGLRSRITCVAFSTELTCPCPVPGKGLSLTDDEAMANDFRHGMAVLAGPGVVDGVSRFCGGACRGGAPA